MFVCVSVIRRPCALLMRVHNRVVNRASARTTGVSIVYTWCHLSFDQKYKVIYCLGQELPPTTTSHCTNALLALPSDMPCVGQWDC